MQAFPGVGPQGFPRSEEYLAAGLPPPPQTRVCLLPESLQYWQSSWCSWDALGILAPQSFPRLASEPFSVDSAVPPLSWVEWLPRASLLCFPWPPCGELLSYPPPESGLGCEEGTQGSVLQTFLFSFRLHASCLLVPPVFCSIPYLLSVSGAPGQFSLAPPPSFLS